MFTDLRSSLPDIQPPLRPSPGHVSERSVNHPPFSIAGRADSPARRLGAVSISNPSSPSRYLESRSFSPPPVSMEMGALAPAGHHPLSTAGRIEVLFINVQGFRVDP